MRSMTLIILCCIVLLSCERNKDIKYPDQGNYGISILSYSYTSFSSTVPAGSTAFTYFSFRAELPKSNSVRIYIKNTTPDSVKAESARWWVESSTQQGWGILPYDVQEKEQEFLADGQVDADVRMRLTGTGTATIYFYENEASVAVRIKEINW